MEQEQKITVTKKQAELIKSVLWMGVEWAKSLIDCNVPNGKTDLKTAATAYKLIQKKLNKTP